MQWPVNVNELKGTTKSPVTQVTDVAVKRASVKLKGPIWLNGIHKRSVPRNIKPARAHIMMRPGEENKFF